MAIFFRAIPPAFYDTRDVGAPPLPEGVVEISPEHHASLIEAQRNGDRIAADAQGHPMTIATDRGRPASSSVTNYQLRAALMARPAPGNKTQFDVVDTEFAKGRDKPGAQGLVWQAWEQANTFVRSGMVARKVMTTLHYSVKQMDDLFTEAAKIEA